MAPEWRGGGGGGEDRGIVGPPFTPLPLVPPRKKRHQGKGGRGGGNQFPIPNPPLPLPVPILGADQNPKRSAPWMGAGRGRGGGNTSPIIIRQAGAEGQAPNLLSDFFFWGGGIWRNMLQFWSAIFFCHSIFRICLKKQEEMLPNFVPNFFLAIRFQKFVIENRGKCCPIFFQKKNGPFDFQNFVVKTGGNAAQFFPRIFF